MIDVIAIVIAILFITTIPQTLYIYTLNIVTACSNT